ncbi:MAG: serine protease [Thermoleophilia bacterium]|nr:serine protease [Thermoleophilia bacterium]
MSQASTGAATIAGGGGSTLSAALQQLVAAVEALNKAIQPLLGTKVAGVQGGQAAATQYVARPATTTSASNEDHDFEKRVTDLINQERAKQGLAPVSYNSLLDNAAEKHASHMAQVGAMAHGGIGDGDPGSRIRNEGFGKAWGENVATGQTSPEQVVKEWMASPTHRANIMDPNFRQMGVAYVTAPNGRSYWAQEFGAA